MVKHLPKQLPKQNSSKPQPKEKEKEKEKPEVINNLLPSSAWNVAFTAKPQTLIQRCRNFFFGREELELIL